MDVRIFTRKTKCIVHIQSNEIQFSGIDFRFQTSVRHFLISTLTNIIIQWSSGDNFEFFLYNFEQWCVRFNMVSNATEECTLFTLHITPHTCCAHLWNEIHSNIFLSDSIDWILSWITEDDWRWMNDRIAEQIGTSLVICSPTTPKTIDFFFKFRIFRKEYWENDS